MPGSSLQSPWLTEMIANVQTVVMRLSESKGQEKSRFVRREMNDGFRRLNPSYVFAVDWA
jgi:hypothetical protein